jgi:predicted N-acetyltransferase YhbS
MSHSRIIRSAAQPDDDAIWSVIEPVFRAGETYPLPRDIARADAFAYWRASGNEVFVAEDGGRIVAPITCAPTIAVAAATLRIAVILSRQTPVDAGWHGRCAYIRWSARAGVASPPCSSIL